MHILCPWTYFMMLKNCIRFMLSQKIQSKQTTNFYVNYNIFHKLNSKVKTKFKWLWKNRAKACIPGGGGLWHPRGGCWPVAQIGLLVPAIGFAGGRRADGEHQDGKQERGRCSSGAHLGQKQNARSQLIGELKGALFLSPEVYNRGRLECSVNREISYARCPLRRTSRCVMHKNVTPPPRDESAWLFSSSLCLHMHVVILYER